MGKEQMILEIWEMLEKLYFEDVGFLHGMIRRLMEKRKSRAK